MTICSVHTIIRWLKESRSAWVWSSSSSENLHAYPSDPMKPKMLHKLDIFSISLQALCMTSLWEKSFYDHYVQRCLALQNNCYKQVPWHWTSRSQFPSNFFFSFSSSSHNLLRLSFFTECWFSASSHQMKNTCSGLLVPVFLFPCLFNGKGKTEDNSLLCKRVL